MGTAPARPLTSSAGVPLPKRTVDSAHAHSRPRDPAGLVGRAVAAHAGTVRGGLLARSATARSSSSSSDGGGPGPGRVRAAVTATARAAVATLNPVHKVPSEGSKSTPPSRAAMIPATTPSGSLRKLPSSTDAELVIDLPTITAVLDDAYTHHTAEIGYDTAGHLCLTDADYAVAQQTGSSLLYGEVLPSGVVRMLDDNHLRAHAARRLFDLGMGTGKLCMQAWLMYTNLIEVHGVELAPSRYAAAEDAAVRLAANSRNRFRIHRWVRGEEIIICEEAGPHMNSDDLADPALHSMHTRCAACGEHSRCRLLVMRCCNLFDLCPKDVRRADIIVMETDLPESAHARLCRFIAMCKRRTRLLTYLNLRSIWPPHQHPAFVPCPLRQVASNMTLTDRFATSWAFQTGHHFFLWKCTGELLPDQLLHPVPMYPAADEPSAHGGHDDEIVFMHGVTDASFSDAPMPLRPRSKSPVHRLDARSTGGPANPSRDNFSLSYDILLPPARHDLVAAGPNEGRLVDSNGAEATDGAHAAGVLVSHVVEDDDGEMIIEERFESMIPMPVPTHLSRVRAMEVTEPAASSRSRRASAGGRGSIPMEGGMDPSGYRTPGSRLLIRVPIGADWAVDCGEDDLVMDERGYIVGIRLRTSDTILSAVSSAATTAATMSLTAAMHHRDTSRHPSLHDARDLEAFSTENVRRTSASDVSGSVSKASSYDGRRTGDSTRRAFDETAIARLSAPHGVSLSGGHFSYSMPKAIPHVRPHAAPPKTGWRLVRSRMRQALGIPKVSKRARTHDSAIATEVGRQ